MGTLEALLDHVPENSLCLFEIGGCLTGEAVLNTSIIPISIGTLFIYKQNVNRTYLEAFNSFSQGAVLSTRWWTCWRKADTVKYRWQLLAEASSPKIYQAPLASGYSGTVLYCKDHQNMVHVWINISRSTPMPHSETFATLPEGFRPNVSNVIGEGMATAYYDKNAPNQRTICMCKVFGSDGKVVSYNIFGGDIYTIVGHIQYLVA
ncbi:hypothetical protein [Harryflintia acetispora]|uniref:hypothetical protein n=1 Tax=Harryflintia acetispora TaxID=1849041 RepID=UPI001898ED2A|nr:hypothetical protein [Harryflintia acetispora]